ncbi:MAG: DUF3192 domain-containing protein [Candidatus Omnitrophica bacterium]|nr:DUF3192 domain-containing protein [Candidatus Omnitrophota bacterium]
MKTIILSGILIVFILSGCTTMDYDTDYGHVPSIPVFESMEKKFLDLTPIYIGMSEREVKSVLGQDVVVGFSKSPDVPGSFDPIVVQNPYRTEVISGGAVTYDVLYYFYAVKKSDGIIAEEELYPLVFDEGRLVGKGWDFLFKLKNKSS